LEVTCALSAHRIVSVEYRRLGLTPTNDRPTEAELAEVLEADYVVGQSKFTVESLLEYGVAPGKIILQPLGVDTERFYPAPRQDHPRPFRALFVGQLSMRKGLHRLLEAWDLLQLPNAELVLAGQVTNQQGYELLHKYKGTYRLLGFVPHSELPKVYQDSNIFIFPSLAEGSSNATYEALASGLPSVVTTSSGALVRDGVEGYVIDPGDLDALKDRVQRLYLDRGLREQMGVAARRRAEQYTWQHFGRRLRLMYEHICKGSSESTEILDMTER
jgi:glycosyltransferase involved in cell wall biosynthesis